MQGEWRPIPQVNKDTGIPALTTPEFLTKRSYSWILCAMANFYGALTVQQAFRIIEQQNPGLTTQRLLEKFLLLYTELHNTTRMPENYGHTPEELFESERIRRVVGRNDPCPCGSGKKYKKCCGRNVN